MRLCLKIIIILYLRITRWVIFKKDFAPYNRDVIKILGYRSLFEKLMVILSEKWRCEVVQIVGVIPKRDRCLEIHFNNRHTVILDLAQKLKTVRFSCLNDDAVFEKASTDGSFIRWEKKVELSLSEVMQLIQR